MIALSNYKFQDIDFRFSAPVKIIKTMVIADGFDG
jgi:hypothetical protein